MLFQKIVVIVFCVIVLWDVSALLQVQLNCKKCGLLSTYIHFYFTCMKTTACIEHILWSVELSMHWFYICCLELWLYWTLPLDPLKSSVDDCMRFSRWSQAFNIRFMMLSSNNNSKRLNSIKFSVRSKQKLTKNWHF